jgi:hypothetical protein
MKWRHDMHSFLEHPRRTAKCLDSIEIDNKQATLAQADLGAQPIDDE